jgi:hypothetical protein
MVKSTSQSLTVTEQKGMNGAGCIGTVTECNVDLE